MGGMPFGFSASDSKFLRSSPLPVFALAKAMRKGAMKVYTKCRK